GDRLGPDDRRAIVHLLRDLSTKAIQPATSLTAPPIRVEPERLLHAARNPENWVLYAGDYGQHRYTSLASINRSMVKNLVPVWSFQTGVPDGLTGMPLAVDGVIYLSSAGNHVFFIDALFCAETLYHECNTQ